MNDVKLFLRALLVVGLVVILPWLVYGRLEESAEPEQAVVPGWRDVEAQRLELGVQDLQSRCDAILRRCEQSEPNPLRILTLGHVDLALQRLARSRFRHYVDEDPSWHEGSVSVLGELLDRVDQSLSEDGGARWIGADETRRSIDRCADIVPRTIWPAPSIHRYELRSGPPDSVELVVRLDNFWMRKRPKHVFPSAELEGRRGRLVHGDEGGMTFRFLRPRSMPADASVRARWWRGTVLIPAARDSLMFTTIETTEIRLVCPIVDE